jgi:hypothetical protein
MLMCCSYTAIDTDVERGVKTRLTAPRQISDFDVLPASYLITSQTKIGHQPDERNYSAEIVLFTL